MAYYLLEAGELFVTGRLVVASTVAVLVLERIYSVALGPLAARCTAMAHEGWLEVQQVGHIVRLVV